MPGADHRGIPALPPFEMDPFMRTPSHPSIEHLSNEIARLGSKIDALTAQLQPSRSAIITGPEVERVFKMLRGE